MIPETGNPQEAKSVCRISTLDMLRLIRVDTLRRVHNVGFLAERLKFLNSIGSDHLCPHLQSYQYLHTLTEYSNTFV